MKTELSILRHKTERDLSLAREAIKQYEETHLQERLDLTLFYMQAVLETINRRLDRLRP